MWQKNDSAAIVIAALALLAPVAASADGIYSAVLPFARTVGFGQWATAYGTIINDGTTTAENCRIERPGGFAGSFLFHPTNPVTNDVEGPRDAPVSIGPGEAQTFVFAMQSSRLGTRLNFPEFVCDNREAAPKSGAVNGFVLTTSQRPEPDLLMIAATPGGDGIVTIPGLRELSFFSAAAINIGPPGAVKLFWDTGRLIAGFGNRSLPVVGYICETTSAGTFLQCTDAKEAGSAGVGEPFDPDDLMTRTWSTGQVRYFTVVLKSLDEAIPFDPAAHRVVFGAMGMVEGNVEHEITAGAFVAVRTE